MGFRCRCCSQCEQAFTPHVFQYPIRVLENNLTIFQYPKRAYYTRESVGQLVTLTTYLYVYQADLNAVECYWNVILQTLFMLEPFATVPNEITYEILAAFYGTNASCNIPGADYIAVYDQWQFAKIRTGNNVSNTVKGKESNFEINESCM